ncbi:MAG: hypothetical protein OXC14_17245 [Rhodospirillaceae bacterium]|nr:hypothetical protein [Rhodospirillaceae bacterium]
MLIVDYPFKPSEAGRMVHVDGIQRGHSAIHACVALVHAFDMTVNLIGYAAFQPSGTLVHMLNLSLKLVYYASLHVGAFVIVQDHNGSNDARNGTYNA